MKVVFTENKGVSHARNLGALYAKGEYLLFIDDDDLIDINYLKESIEILNENKDICLVYSYSKRFGLENKIWKIKEFSYLNLLKVNCFYVSCVIRTKDFIKSDKFNEKMDLGLEDWDFWINFLKDKQKVYRINKIMFFYRIKNRSRTTDLISNETSIIEMYKKIYVKNKDIYDKEKISEELFLNDIFFKSKKNALVLKKMKYLFYSLKVLIINKINNTLRIKFLYGVEKSV